MHVSSGLPPKFFPLEVPLLWRATLVRPSLLPTSIPFSLGRGSLHFFFPRNLSTFFFCRRLWPSAYPPPKISPSLGSLFFRPTRSFFSLNVSFHRLCFIKSFFVSVHDFPSFVPGTDRFSSARGNISSASFRFSNKGASDTPPPVC